MHDGSVVRCLHPCPSPVATVFARSRGGVPGTDLVPLPPPPPPLSLVSLKRPARSRRSFRLLRRKLMVLLAPSGGSGLSSGEEENEVYLELQTLAKEWGASVV